MFVNTCGGDQNPLPRRSVELCQKYGHMLAAGVEQALEGALKPLSAELRTAYRLIDLSYIRVADRAALRKALQSNNAILSRWAGRMLRKLDEGATFPPAYPYPPARLAARRRDVDDRHGRGDGGRLRSALQEGVR